MIYDAKDCARLQSGVWLASVAAWAGVLALPEAACHGPAAAFGNSLEVSIDALGAMAPGWALMLVAMMAPMTLGALYQIRIASFAGRRWRSSALFLAGYAAVWMAIGAGLVAIELTARRLAPGSYLPALLVGGVALVWQASPAKQRCLNRCHAHRALRAFGLAADWDALRMGLAHGVWCVGSCWAAMLFPLLLPEGHRVAMAAVTLLMFCERLDRPQAPSWRWRGFRTAFLLLRMRVAGPRSSPPPYGSTASS